jgi:hypothetical protein
VGKSRAVAESSGTFDLLVVKTGLINLILAGLSGLGIAILAWMNKAPLYQVIVAAMMAIGAVLFIVNQGLRLITASKLPSFLSRQQARRLDRQDPDGVRIGGNITLFITLLASALIIVGGLYATNTYSTWRNNIENTFLSIIPGQVTIDFNKEWPLQVNYTVVNHGNLAVVSPTKGEAFEYFDTLRPTDTLPPADEDHYFRILDASITPPGENGIIIYPLASDMYATAEDSRFTKKQWDAFQAKKLKIYL